MANMIEPNRIPGASVYGVEQYSYTVNGVAGKDYAAALSAASFKEAVAIEQALSAYSEVVRQRMRKLDDLGTVMAILNTAYATLKTKEQESGDTTANMPSLADAKATAAKYGVFLLGYRPQGVCALAKRLSFLYFSRQTAENNFS